MQKSSTKHTRSITKQEDGTTSKLLTPTVSLTQWSFQTLHLNIFLDQIDTGSVEVRAIAREAGSRSKIAVASKEESIDPIGSLVGQKGVRVQTVINELSGEKIDIILWNDSAKQFIAQSFSPAKVLDVKIIDEERKHALVEVSEDQFSLAIGKKGQNVRLAAKLTGWKIDVRSPKENLGFEEAVAPVVAEESGEAVPTEVVEIAPETPTENA